MHVQSKQDVWDVLSHNIFPVMYLWVFYNCSFSFVNILYIIKGQNKD